MSEINGDGDARDFGDLKHIEPIPGMRKNAPRINWGDEYKSRTMAERLEYAEALASSMNHAADVLQQERAALLEECVTLKKLAENADSALAIQKTVTINQLTAGNAQVQELSTAIQSLQAELRKANQTIEDLRR